MKISYQVKLMSHVPWVTRTRAAHQCDGYRTMSFKALRNPELKERYRCKSPARWKFTALPPSSDPFSGISTSGTYCWQHLRQQQQEYNESERLDRWVADNQSLVQKLREKRHRGVTRGRSCYQINKCDHPECVEANRQYHQIYRKVRRGTRQRQTAALAR